MPEAHSLAVPSNLVSSYQSMRLMPLHNQHSFVTGLISSGYDIRTMQELLGYKDVKTTMVYTHVLNQGPKGVRSPIAEV
jgi:site-specific recombinase XerD